MEELVGTAIVVAIIALAWWLLWTVLALARRDLTLALFLLVTGVLFGLAEVTLALRGSVAAFALLVIPPLIVLVLGGIVVVLAVYEEMWAKRKNRLR